MHAAALFLFAIQCLDADYDPAEMRIERKPEFELVKIAPPDLRGTKYRRLGDVTVYSGEQIQLFIEENRLLRLYVERGGRWWQLHEGDGPPVVESSSWEKGEPVVVRRERELIAVTYTGRSSDGRTTKTLLLDFRPARPAVKLLVECLYALTRGRCVHIVSRTQLTCDARLRCTSIESLPLDWTTRTATRTFDLLTDETFPPERLGAVRHRSGDAYARAFAADRAVIGQRVVLDQVGPVTPVFELSRDSVLFAGPANEARVAVRFFHLTPGSWREIAVTLLTDDGYPAASEKRQVAAGHTPDAPRLLFFAWDIEYTGKGRLVEVLAREGEARSLYWIMFDPNGRTSAIRLATDTPDVRDCDTVVYPPSLTSLCIPDPGLPAYVTAIRSWRMGDLEQGRMPKRCELVGRLAWSSSKGWQPTLVQAPCSDPSPRPHATTLDDAGTLGTRIVRPR